MGYCTAYARRRDYGHVFTNSKAPPRAITEQLSNFGSNSNKYCYCSSNDSDLARVLGVFIMTKTERWKLPGG